MQIVRVKCANNSKKRDLFAAVIVVVLCAMYKFLYRKIVKKTKPKVSLIQRVREREEEGESFPTCLGLIKINTRMNA